MGKWIKEIIAHSFKAPPLSGIIQNYVRGQQSSTSVVRCLSKLLCYS